MRRTTVAANQLISSKTLLVKWLVVFHVFLLLLLLMVAEFVDQKASWANLLSFSLFFTVSLFIYFYLFEFLYIDDASFCKGRMGKRVFFDEIESLMYYGLRNREFLDVAILFHGRRATTISLMFISDKEAFFEKFPWAKFHEATKGVLQKRPPPL